ncbi:hypothetical protein BE20_18200 [Sorangium cellulosum]|uniref:Uncharacterized protein n=1 Tax=Sorangium cellulosum TaxID=56 RepID=A0A150SCX4_SORCE|nr:hypothetical protein BE20_18200 [Sorangium cellulosum]KYF93977.1 hypothetical protein BE18_31955 [Sorangium cellulosum]
MSKRQKVTPEFIVDVNQSDWREDNFHHREHGSRLGLWDGREWEIGGSLREMAPDGRKRYTQARSIREQDALLLRESEALPDGRFQSGGKLYWLVDRDGYAVAEPVEEH